MKNKPALLVEVVTDEGLVGVGEAAHFGGPMSSTAHVIEQELKPYLVGKDPINTELNWDLMHRRAYKHGRGGIVVAAISGIDIALWDLKGKVSGLPCWRLMGGYRKRVPAYATGGFYSCSKDNDALIDEMQTYIKAGFRAVKMKVGRNSSMELSPLRASEECGIAEVSLEEDIKRVELVRQTIGPDIKLCVDANGAWDVATAVKMGRKLEPYDIYWLEEPVWPDDILGSKEVAQKLSIPVAGYETCSYGMVDFQKYISHRAVHFVQPDVAWSGGLTECLKIAHLAQAANLPLAPHIHGSAVAVAAGLHLLGAIKNGSMAETVFPAHPLMTQLVKAPLAIDEDTGDITLSEAPGLGIELNLDVVDRYRTNAN
ncbi:MAG: mandelate racemase/muconate lactonizing enzyme family protein [Burkholderiales bacterium]|nr:mandelate racemase/muconate lactonizing enzyme family protein [Burkholderiales bacterium]|tara:strand:- start:448 stop:1560 length:1113 start_codon:yes stop_codon:yes gene_type:complete